jgi:hypothetical protein
VVVRCQIVARFDKDLLIAAFPRLGDFKQRREKDRITFARDLSARSNPYPIVGTILRENEVLETMSSFLVCIACVKP